MLGRYLAVPAGMLLLVQAAGAQSAVQGGPQAVAAFESATGEAVAELERNVADGLASEKPPEAPPAIQ